MPNDGADRIDKEARGGQGRQAVNVGRRIELDNVESCDSGPPAEAREQVDHLSVGEGPGVRAATPGMMLGSRLSQSKVTTTRAPFGICRRAASAPSA